VLLALPGAALAQTPQLALPVDCTIGETCLVQKLVDLQAGPGRQDYRCGTLTTEEHDGVDFRLRTLADMAKGTAVVAAADGIVLRARDGMADRNIRLSGLDSIGGKQAGNGVVISHGSGWESQYSHLRNGSVRVKPGDKVKAGDVLGLIGMSGNAEFPHLHFSIRKDGKAVDPFLNAGNEAACLAASAPQPAGLWSIAAAKALRYTATGMIAAGFTDGPADTAAMRSRTAPLLKLPASSPALVFWIDGFGVQAGDIEKVEIIAPKGTVLLSARKPIAKPALSWFAFFGKKQPPGGWNKGAYKASYQLLRGGILVASIQSQIMVD
jgi:hypothetical protein